MNRTYSSIGLAARIWISTCLILTLGVLFYFFFFLSLNDLWFSLLVLPGAAIGSIPVLIILWVALSRLKNLKISLQRKFTSLLLVCLLSISVYGIIGGLINYFGIHSRDILLDFIEGFLIVTTILFICSCLAILLHTKKIQHHFTSSYIQIQTTQSIKMETTQHPDSAWDNNSTSSNKTMIKGIITGVLILVMMIPTIFITNLIKEREDRQKEVAKEVSSKWAASQTLTGPYLYIPYKTFYEDKDGKTQESSNYFWILPDNLHVSGRVDHEIRPRSIYKVLLYRASLQDSGNFIIQVPKTIDASAIIWSDVKICYGLSDFKGIEERLAVQLKGTEYELSPGLPQNDISGTGLSSTASLTAEDLGKSISFDMKLKLKGSEQLHFIPLAGNSSFSLQSGWGSPSFDGSNLPSERDVNPLGFSAKWAFNKANLPFGTVLKDFKFDLNTVAFGVTLLQPADQYAKTSRSVKYAILFIGLTFALFFIVELTQNKPVHPVQYVLIGLALVIFYTLLLSFSEFILFDYSYLIASLATILLITLYARSHFQNWKSAGIFGGILTGLYGFIFVLIRLEDTALLVGSIGLFIVLAIVMYASRKINWYGTPVQTSNP